MDILILTHLHWDHSQNCDLFTNAIKYVWAEELQYSMCPVALQAKPYDAPIHPNTRWPVVAQQGIIFEPIWKDNTEIVPGVTYFHTPGHTPGHCSVAVETRVGTYVIAADVIQINEGLERRVPRRADVEHARRDGFHPQVHRARHEGGIHPARPRDFRAGEGSVAISRQNPRAGAA